VIVTALALGGGGRRHTSTRTDRPVAQLAAPGSLFPVNGLFAAGGLDTADAVAGRADIGSDRSIHFANPAVSISGRLEYLAAFPPYCWNGSCASTNHCSGGCQLVQLSSPLSIDALPDSAWAKAKSANDDASIDWGANTTYAPGTAEVSSSANDRSITIPGGTYYFCDVSFDGSAITLRTTGTAANPVVIYIDSPARPGSGCAPGSGRLAGANSFTLANASGVASNLQIYLYGDPRTCAPSKSGFDPSRYCPDDLSPNSTSMTADVYAPFSSARFGGPMTITGQMDIGYLTANNDLTLRYQGPAPTNAHRVS
jgi:hypothetical protein